MLNINPIELKAEEFARTFYKGHQRISGENYFDHVQSIVRELHYIKVDDVETIVLAYLHHVPDFDPKIYDKIESEFGKDVSSLLKIYKKLAKTEIPNVKPNHINEKVIIQTFLNLVKDPRLLVLRIIDKAENIKTAHILSREKAQEVAYRALYIYSPICRLLGLYKYVRILEDNAFKLLRPGEYLLIARYVRSKESEYVSNLTDAKKIISELLTSGGIKNAIWYRIKSYYSIYLKALSHNLQITQKELSKIKDIAAMRILVETEEDCYIAEDILQQLFDSYEEKRDDYILKPKPSGYKSIHNIFKLSNNLEVEIQIKTFSMHDYNEYGLGSHAFYKLGKDLENKILKNQNQSVRN